MPRDYSKSQFHEEPKRQRTVYFTDAAWDAIEAIAAPKGYSRSELLEQAARQSVLEQVNPKEYTNFTLRLPPNEETIINRYCQLTGRTKTDVIREFVRSLEVQINPRYSTTTVSNGKTEGEMIGLLNAYPAYPYSIENNEF